MKRILITGANSYIGNAFSEYINKYPDEYQVSTIDMTASTWRENDFSKYDVVFHVAGIAHTKETKQNEKLFYLVNRDLAIETARKAKSEGVKQFVFMSSMSVYGLEMGKISKATLPNPKSNYGKSKLQAEQSITELDDQLFKVVILRPPMVYGEGCKGNYQKVIKIVECSPVFPRVNNKRSQIHVDNLISFVKLAIDNELQGVFFPQNKEYNNIRTMAEQIAKAKGKKIYFSYLLGWLVVLLRPFFSVLRKAFGDLIYVDTDEFDFAYCRVPEE